MRIRNGLLGLCFWLFLSSVAFAADITVTIPAEVTVNGGPFTLSEIATISGDSDLVQQLGSFEVGNSPQPGHSIVLTPDLLRVRFMRFLANFPAEIAWEVPPSIRVTTAAQTLTAAQLEAQVIQAVRDQTAGLDCEIKVLSSEDILVPPGDVTYQVSFPSGIHFVGTVTAQIGVSVNQKLYRQVPIRLKVDSFKPILVAARALQAGEVIDDGAVTFDRRNVDYNMEYFTDKTQAIGLTAKRPIAAGTVLYNGLLAKPIVVKRGTLLAVVAKVGTIQAAITAKALEDGAVGQVIRVQNLQSKKIITAKVVDANTAEVTAALP